MPTVRLRDFTGGLNLPGERAPATPQPGFAVPANALLRAENVGEYLPTGGVRGRLGREAYADAPGVVTGLHRHYMLPSIGSTGPSATATATNYAGGAGTGGPVWYDLEQIPFIGNAAKVDLALVESEYLMVGGFGHAIPSGATVNGIEVEVYGAGAPGAAGAVRDAVVRIARAGEPVGTNKAKSFTNWPVIVGLRVYGGPGELWGLSWTPAEAEDVTLAIAVKSTAGAQTAGIHTVRVTIFYSAAAVPCTLVAVQAGGTQSYHHRAGQSAGALSAVDGGGGLFLGASPVFVNWPEKRATFLFDGVNPALRYDGARVSVVASGAFGAPHRGRAAALWKNRLWATDPAETGYSVYATDINQETQWRPTLHFSANDSEGGVIQALVPFGDRLLIVKDTSLFFFVGDIEFGGQLVQFSTEGCVAARTVAATPFGVIYLGRGGLMLTDGETPEPAMLSAAVESLFVDRFGPMIWRDAVGVYFPRRQQYWLKLSPEADDVWVVHRVLVPRTGGTAAEIAWSHWPSVPLAAAAVWDGEAADQGDIIVADAAGRILRADTGTTDEGAAIPVEVQTAFRDVDRDRRRGRVYRVRGHYRGRTALTGGIRYDQAASDQVALALGQASAEPAYQDPLVTIHEQATFGRTVSLRVAAASGGAEFELHRIEADVLRRSMRAWS